MARYWHQNRQVDQWYCIEDMETYPHKYSDLILDKGDKNLQGRKIASSTNSAGKTGNSHAVK